MKKMISYSLFGTSPRYHGNLAYVLVANSVIYSDFCMKFYVHEDATETKQFGMLQKVSEIFPNVEIEIMKESYEGTKPTTWRMKPLWGNDVDLLLCRDLDHITNKLERKSVQYFLNHNAYLIHGIRSYALHSAPYLAGLVGFRCKALRPLLFHMANCFEDYIRWGENFVEYCKDWRWGCDQALMRDFFCEAKMFRKSLDTPQYTAPQLISRYTCNTVMPEQYRRIKETPGCNKACLAYSESIAPSFTGQAVTATTNQTKELIEKADNDMARLISKYI